MSSLLEDCEAEVFETPDAPEGGQQTSEAASGGAGAATAVEVDVGDIVEASISARDAFEVFMGRRYDPAERDLDIDNVTAQSVLLPSHDQFEAMAKHLKGKLESGLSARQYASRAVVPKKLETPLAKYTRLMVEVAQLAAELRDAEAAHAASASASASAASRSAGGAAAAMTPEKDIVTVLSAGTAALQQRLEGMKGQVERAQASGGGAGVGATGGAAALPDAVARPLPPGLHGDPAVIRDMQASLAAAAASMRAGLAAVEAQLSRLGAS